MRGLLVAAFVGAVILGYTVFWWHWPLILGGGAAAILGGLTWLGTLARGNDRARDDAAWRAANPDLEEPRPEPSEVALRPAGADDAERLPR